MESCPNIEALNYLAHLNTLLTQTETTFFSVLHIMPTLTPSTAQMVLSDLLPVWEYPWLWLLLDKVVEVSVWMGIRIIGQRRKVVWQRRRRIM